MKRQFIIISIIAALTCSMAGCTYTDEYVEKDTTTDVITTNEVGIPSLSQELDVIGEDFKLVCDYDIGSYSLNDWHVTDCKDVGMKVHTKGLPEGYEVAIDHVHADISLMSTSAQTNGITQDSMDDTYHGYEQDGFFINDTTDYYNIFSIEGYTDQFYTLWGCCVNGYGSEYTSYDRLTESNLIKTGTYAEKLSVVYDISIKTPDSDKYYVKSVKSTIAIPVSQNITTVQKDLLTGKVVGTTSTETSTVKVKVKNAIEEQQIITVAYDGVDFDFYGQETYNKYSDKIGKSVDAVLETYMYADGSKKYYISELK